MPSETRPRKPFDWDRLTALSALLVSIATVVFLGYQTLLMRTQVEASIWPYVQIGTSCCSEGFRIGVQNKGVGPAIIKYAVVKVDGKPQKTWKQALTALLGAEPGDFDSDGLSHRVMAPNEAFNALDVKSADIAVKIVTEAKKGRLSGAICYCSVLDECSLATTAQTQRQACPAEPPAIPFAE